MFITFFQKQKCNREVTFNTFGYTFCFWFSQRLSRFWNSVTPLHGLSIHICYCVRLPLFQNDHPDGFRSNLNHLCVLVTCFNQLFFRKSFDQTVLWDRKRFPLFLANSSDRLMRRVGNQIEIIAVFISDEAKRGISIWIISADNHSLSALEQRVQLLDKYMRRSVLLNGIALLFRKLINTVLKFIHCLAALVRWDDFMTFHKQQKETHTD